MKQVENTSQFTLVTSTDVVPRRLNIVFFGLSITSSWGNGHATTYRGLVRELALRGHDVLFLERDQEWYASNRDQPNPPYATVELYQSLSQLKQRFSGRIRNADLVVVGSYVPEGSEIGNWITALTNGVTAFYDIDTPVTLAKLENGGADYVSRALVSRYHLYLSFTGGPLLDRIRQSFGARKVHPLYCSVDNQNYFHEALPLQWDLGYMGTYSSDRQQALEQLLLAPSRKWSDGRFVVAGPQYPNTVEWPANVGRIPHVSPSRHRAFYNAQRFTLNITRAQMVAAGHSPSVRLFEAAACGTPIISDAWPGLDHFFKANDEILIAESPQDTLRFLREIPERTRVRIGQAARSRVLSNHTARHRAAELERYVLAIMNSKDSSSDMNHEAGDIWTNDNFFMG